MVVLVTGANGQLGQSLQFISGNFPEMNFVFCTSSQLDITNLELNANLRIEDIKVPNMEIMNSPRIPVASVVMTRQLKQEESEAAKADKK